jgi:hypothetical protein
MWFFHIKTIAAAHHAGDRLFVQTPIRERLARIASDWCRWPLDAARRGGEARRWRGLDEAVYLDKGLARGIVRMFGRFGEREYRGEADIGILKQIAPLLASASREYLLQYLLHLGPGAAVVLGLGESVARAGFLQQQGIELRLD